MKVLRVLLMVAVLGVACVVGLVVGQDAETKETVEVTSQTPDEAEQSAPEQPPSNAAAAQPAANEADAAPDKSSPTPVESANAAPADANQAGETPAATAADPNAPADPNTPAGEKADEQADDQKKEGEEEKKAEEDLEAINLNNVEMKVIMQKLGDWTGKPIIPTNDEVLGKKITIYSTHKVSREQALSLIYAALRAKGVIAEHAEDKIYLKPIAEARQGYVPTLGPEDPLERMQDKSMIVEKFFRLQNYSASRMVQIITPLLAEYGHVTALENSNDVVVIDTVENLLRVQRTIQQLDVFESDKEVEQVFELKNADPTEVVQVLDMILNEEDDRRRDYRRYDDRRGGSSSSGQSKLTPATSVTITSTEIPIRLIPMPRQGWIIARASAQDMDVIADWIKKLDVTEGAQPGQTVVPVRYVDPREVVSAVRRALQEIPGTDIETNIVVEALTQSKQIVIFGSEENRKVVEMLIAKVDLPGMDIFREETFKLKYADPDRIKEKILGLYESQAGSFSSYSNRGYSYRNVNPEDAVKVVADNTFKQITVIASEKNLAKIRKQIEEWDVPLNVGEDQYRIIPIQNSDPVQMADLLSRLFSEDTGSSTNLFRRLLFGDDEDSQSKIVGSLYGMLTFEPVPGTKKIIVISKLPEAYDIIEQLVKKLDSEDPAEVPKVITLKYADCEDLCDQLNALLNEGGTTATLRRSSRGLSEFNQEEGSSSGGAGGNNQNGDAGTIQPWWNRQRLTQDEVPTSNLIGKVRFIPVHRSKALLVLAPEEYMADIDRMVAALDQPGMQVMVKVVIVEVDLNNMTSLGVQLSSDPGVFGNLGENAIEALTQLTQVQQNGSVTIESTVNVGVLVDLLVKRVNARVLNQPTLWTKDNEEAVFIKGQKVALLESEQVDRTNVNSVQRTFNYEDVGVILRIRPNITPEKAVDLSVNLIVSQVEPELINSQIAINNLDTTTNMIVGDGQTIILGGILYQNDSIVQTKVPLLGDIPIVGGAFRHEDTQQRNNELLVFVTPYVIDEQRLASIPADPDTVDEIEKPRQKLRSVLQHMGVTLDRSLEKVEDLRDEEDEPINGQFEPHLPPAIEGPPTPAEEIPVRPDPAAAPAGPLVEAEGPPVTVR